MKNVYIYLLTTYFNTTGTIVGDLGKQAMFCTCSPMHMTALMADAMTAFVWLQMESGLPSRRHSYSAQTCHTRLSGGLWHEWEKI